MSNSLIDEKNRSAEHWGIKTKKILKYNWKNLENHSRPARTLNKVYYLNSKNLVKFSNNQTEKSLCSSRKNSIR